MIFLALFALLQGAKPDATSIAARVNDEIITWDEVDLRLAKSSKGTTPEDREALRQGELRKVVQERLFQLEAKRLQITIGETEIDSTVERVKKLQIAKPGETKDEIDKHFDEWLRVMERKSYTEYREALRIDLMASAVRRRLVQDSFRAPNLYSTLLAETVTPDEIREYYEKHKERYKPILQIYVTRICLQFDPKIQGSKEEKLQMAESLKRKIAAGAEFRALLMLYGDLKNEKGDPTLVLRPDDTTFSPDTKAILFHGLPEGKVSGIIIDANSVNLFKMEKYVNEKGDTFEEAQVKIRTELENRKNVENREALRTELLNRYYVRPTDLFPTK